MPGTSKILTTVVGALALGLSAHAGEPPSSFTPGHIFVSMAQFEGCFEPHDPDRIWEVDPATGEVTLFVEIPAELCVGVSSLIFTPDGSRLRATFFDEYQVVEFTPDGSYTVVLDADDGILAPSGLNAMASDSDENFYVINRGLTEVWRFPAGGNAGTVFLDFDDVAPTGAFGIAFASDGDMYCATGCCPSQLLRISPEGEVFVFDEYGLFQSSETLTADGANNVYVGLTFGDIVRYQAGEPDSTEVLVESTFEGQDPIVMSPDETRLYVLDAFRLYSVDVATGMTQLVATVPGFGADLAVVPHPDGDVDFDGDVDLSDYALFRACLTGPHSADPLGECRFSDLHTDGDIDLVDVAVFQSAMTLP